MGKHLDHVLQEDGTYKWELAEIPAVKSTPVEPAKPKPETKKDIQQLRALRKSIKTKLDKIKRDDPKLYKQIQSRSF